MIRYISSKHTATTNKEELNLFALQMIPFPRTTRNSGSDPR